jgi:hypothetical protein
MSRSRSRYSHGLPRSAYEAAQIEESMAQPMIVSCACGWCFGGITREALAQSKLHRERVHPERCPKPRTRSTRSERRGPIMKTCVVCEKEFRAAVSHTVACSTKCRTEHRRRAKNAAAVKRRAREKEDRAAA